MLTLTTEQLKPLLAFAWAMYEAAWDNFEAEDYVAIKALFINDELKEEFNELWEAVTEATE